MESQYQAIKFICEMQFFPPRLPPFRVSLLSSLPISSSRCISRHMIEKNKRSYPTEQNRKTPMWILKPLIDPRDKTLLAQDKNIARPSEPASGKYIFFCLVK